MIKWPEPAEYIWEPDGTFNIGQERGLSPNTGPCNGWKISPVYTESQLKQAVRDALNLAADTCESTLYVEGDGTVSVFGPKTDANVEIRKCRDAIRALIKEI